MFTPKRNGPDGDFFSAGLPRHGEPAGARKRQPLSLIVRQERERRRLSLQDVARLTRIPVKYLQLLEGAEGKRLLAEPLSLIASLRRYAVFLNLNPDVAVTQFITELEQLPPVEEETAGGARQTQLLTHLPPPRSWVVPRTLLLLLVLGVLAFVGSYSALRREQRPNEDKITSLPPPSATASTPESGTPPSVSSPARSAPPADAGQSQPAAPSPAVSPPVAGAPQTESMAAAAPQGTSPVVRSDPQPQQPPSKSLHQLHIQAKEEAWLRITIDGQRTRQFLLHPGQSREWAAKRGFTLTVGNAGGVVLILDGHEVPPLGKSGQVVRNIRFPSQKESQERQERKVERPRATKPR